MAAIVILPKNKSMDESSKVFLNSLCSASSMDEMIDAAKTYIKFDADTSTPTNDYVPYEVLKVGRRHNVVMTYNAPKKTQYQYKW